MGQATVSLRLGGSAVALGALSAGLATLVACGGTPSEPAPAPEASGAAVAAVSPPGAPADGLDVVLITLDTTRADHLGLYGYFRDTSPHLDELGRESLVFDHLVVPMATTLPTHTSLMTGTWPNEHGVLANVQHGGHRFVASEQLVPLAEWLGAQGWTTAAFVSAAPLDTSSGIQRGFGTYSAPATEERLGAETTDAALAWLATAPPSPMLLWVHYYDPHNPYRAPADVEKRFRGDPDGKLGAWLEARDVADVTHRPTGQRVATKPLYTQYDAEIRVMDEQLGRLLDALRERGRLDRTLLVVMGDHGEGLNQHHEPGHGLVWGEQLHPPLLIRAPGVAARRVDTLLSAADVLPTALGLVELPGEDRFLGQASGQDVLAAGFTARPVLSQTSARQEAFGKDLTYALTSAVGKCTWSEAGGGAWYDLRTDPFELAPVSSGAELDACVAELRALVERQQARGRSLGAGRTEKLGDDEIEKLRSLGYVDPEN